MLKYLTTALMGLLILALTNCSGDTAQHEAIQGDWKAQSWTVEGQKNRDASQVRFQFEGDSYQADLGGRQEQGTFRIQGDKLYTKAEGQQEIMVKIARLANDTLAFDMNRGGVSEQMLLVRE